ncbi:MAG: FAD-dependent oxidoreductase [Arenicella sp.]|nr:FAD-dependent oxidoreductase [Arenicella sp.]
MDKDLCEAALNAFSLQGIEFELGHEVTGVEKNKNGHLVKYKSRESGEKKTLSVSHVLVATGRRPNTDGLGLDNIELKPDDRDFLIVDENFRTTAANVWAIGDVTPGMMLAHRAEDEGIAVSEIIAGKVGLVNNQVIPSIVYTHPEIASVGLTETEALERFHIKKGNFPFVANSRAKANRDTQGFVKVIANAEDDTVLGVHIIGAEAGNMIAQAAQAMEFGATSEDIAYTCHAHPTHAEALKEAAMSILGKPIHM